MRHALSNMADECLTNFGRPKRLASVRIPNAQTHAKRDTRKKLKQVSNILKKKESERSDAELYVLSQAPDVVKTAEKNAKRLLQQKERVQEVEDAPDTLDRKCKELAHMLQSSKYTVIYTGAGISTAASIPDYRGPNGVWTLLKKGQSLRPQDLVDAEPTYTHMCITKLFREGMVKYAVSQNCDGLHLRSGFPRYSLSEVHGNMFIEICKNCKPHKEYVRLFDVTERTAKGRHRTGRTCSKCGGSLYDTIVHFGEKGGLKSPYNWRQAAKAASKADLIICLGSSLKVLKCYPCLWSMDKRPQHRPKLAIVNLQWTPKDDSASLKINGRCDDVMRRVASYLGLRVPNYHRETDPLFRLTTPVGKDEEQIASKKVLHPTEVKPKPTSLHRTKMVAKSSDASWSHSPQRTQSVIEKGKSHPLQAANDGLVEWSRSTNKVIHPSLQLHASFMCDNETDVHSAVSAGIGVHARELDPVRVKLEKMLIERGAKEKPLQGPENGVLRHTNDYAIHSQQKSVHPGSQSFQPLPSFQSFLPGCQNQPIKQACYSQLRSLLDGCQSQGHPSALEHDVFRVDLSTNPISITSSCSAAKLEGAAANPVMTNICLDDVFPGHSITEGSIPSGSSNTQAESNYAKLMRNISFDHSYAKSSTRSHSSNKSGARDVHSRTTDGGILSSSPNVDPLSVSWQEEHTPHSQYLQQSVIPIYSDVDCLATQYNGQLFSHQELLSFVQQYLESMPAGMEYQNGELSVLHEQIPVPQDRVVISLDRDLEGPVPTAAHFVPVQQVSFISTADTLNPWAVRSSTQPVHSFPVSEEAVDVGLNSGESESSVESSVKKPQNASASVPGWFGKGLKVRRKRSM